MNFQDTVNSAETIRPLESSLSQKFGAGLAIDNFQLVEKIGRGGLGEVWKAKDLEGDRFVALKFVPKDIQHFENEMAQVKKTFQTIHALQHQHICPVYGLRQNPNWGYYLVMKFLDGVSLDFYCRQRGKISLSQTVRILKAAAEALDYAHRQGVIHRDVKPANIMLDFAKNADGSMNFEVLRDVQLIDFGLASEFRQSLSRVSQVQMSVSGTRPYMSPEQFKGQYQDAFSDQYSLGVTAYEMLAGRLPFAAEDLEILYHCVLNVQPAPIPEFSPAVNSTLLCALAKERDSRFISCAEFVSSLDSAAREAAASEIEIPRHQEEYLRKVDLEQETFRREEELELSQELSQEYEVSPQMGPEQDWNETEKESIVQKCKNFLWKTDGFIGKSLGILMGMCSAILIGAGIDASTALSISPPVALLVIGLGCFIGYGLGCNCVGCLMSLVGLCVGAFLGAIFFLGNDVSVGFGMIIGMIAGWIWSVSMTRKKRS